MEDARAISARTRLGTGTMLRSGIGADLIGRVQNCAGPVHLRQHHCHIGLIEQAVLQFLACDFERFLHDLFVQIGADRPLWPFTDMQGRDRAACRQQVARDGQGELRYPVVRRKVVRMDLYIPLSALCLRGHVPGFSTILGAGARPARMSLNAVSPALSGRCSVQSSAPRRPSKIAWQVSRKSFAV